tara:strand:- start:90 stop:362 length:273 start_codon:yes stop_codon:yes gene_type:complete
MDKFNENITVEETTEYQIGELMNEVNKIKPVSEMTLITPRRNTKWLEKSYIYEVVSGPDSFGYFKVQEPRCVGGHTHFIHKNNMKNVKVV